MVRGFASHLRMASSLSVTVQRLVGLCDNCRMPGAETSAVAGQTGFYRDFLLFAGFASPIFGLIE